MLPYTSSPASRSYKKWGQIQATLPELCLDLWAGVQPFLSLRFTVLVLFPMAPCVAPPYSLPGFAYS